MDDMQEYRFRIHAFACFTCFSLTDEDPEQWCTKEQPTKMILDLTNW